MIDDNLTGVTHGRDQTIPAQRGTLSSSGYEPNPNFVEAPEAKMFGAV